MTWTVSDSDAQINRDLMATRLLNQEALGNSSIAGMRLI